jgi:hypothetical protein
MNNKWAQPRPSPGDAARRLVVLKYVVDYAVATPPRNKYLASLAKRSAGDRRKIIAEAEALRDEFWQPLRPAGLWEYLSPSERELAGTTILTMSREQRCNATWRLEAAQVLMWALRLIPHLPLYDARADRDLLKEIPTGDIPRFVSSAHLRKKSEIERACDDAWTWHWRSRTFELVQEGQEYPVTLRKPGISSFDDVIRSAARQLAQKGSIPAWVEGDFPIKGKAYRNLNLNERSEVRSVTMERHFALNWLCGYADENEWDKTLIDT